MVSGPITVMCYTGHWHHDPSYAILGVTDHNEDYTATSPQEANIINDNMMKIF